MSQNVALKNRKLFWSILKVSVAMLLSVVTLVCLLIYLFMPSFYRTQQRNQYEALLTENLSVLTNSESVGTEIQAMMDILARTQAGFSIFDEDMILVFEYIPVDVNFNLYLGIEDLLTEENEFSIRDVDFSSNDEMQMAQPTILNFNYQTNNGYRTVQVRIPNQPLSDARDVILSIFPIASGIALIFAFLISIIFSHWVVKPINSIQKITMSMANFETDALIPVVNNNEIGELSHGINYLFEQLKTSINALEKEIHRVRDGENRKIDFLQTVSHEMKTPLASANALIEGIRYKIPPYGDNPDYYLEECQNFLSKAITLTKESLRLAEFGREQSEIFSLQLAIEQCVSSYSVIILSKQMTLSTEIPENIMLATNRNLFEKVISNLYANTIYHNNDMGMIEINYDNGFLTFFNTCTSLNVEKIHELFAPLTIANQVENSTGIGLYIVKQLLQQLKVPFQFAPAENKMGMNFTLDLTNIIKTERKRSNDINS